MARQNSLFGEEEFSHKPPKKEDAPLPLIPLAQKRASKNDTPLEKEIRRFNKLIKDLHEYEANIAKEKEYNDLYERLYQQKIVPELEKLSRVKFRFVEHIHFLFGQGKFTKPQQRHFVDMVNGMLRDVIEFVPEARELSRYYLNKQVQLMSKKDKQQFSDMMEEGGINIDMENFDVGNIWEQNRASIEDEFLRDHATHSKAQKEQQQNKKAAMEHQDINVLYRELARLLHPDLEQDEAIRLEKEHLMKDLSRARQHHDLHTMLLIKAKAQRFAPGAESEKKEAGYSLDQLKRFNKELKKKLDEYRSKFMMNSISFDRNGFITGFGGTGSGRSKDPQKEIEMELKEIKAEIRDFETDLKHIQTPEDLKQLIMVDKNIQRSMEDSFGW